jgi:hypothetical protein
MKKILVLKFFASLKKNRLRNQMITIICCLGFSVGSLDVRGQNINEDLVITDLVGQATTLSSIIQQGNIPIFVFFASWDPVSYSYFNNQLNDLNMQEGLAFGGNIQFILVESDPNTSLASIFGQTAGSQGDWTFIEGAIISDDLQLADYFDVSFYPTTYLICPNLSISFFQQNTLLQIPDLINSDEICPVFDPFCINLLENYNNSCGPSNLSLSLVNCGFQSIAQLDVITEGCIPTLSFSGNTEIDWFQNLSLDLGWAEVIDTLKFHLTVVMDDGTLHNVTKISSIYKVVTNSMLVQFQPDSYPGEMSWNIVNSATGQQLVPVTSFIVEGVYNYIFNFEENSCLHFQFNDSYGDGFFDGGFLSISSESSLLFYESGGFSQINENFIVNPIVLGCAELMACNFNPFADLDDGSCLFVNTACSDNNPNTMLDAVAPNCNCIGTPFNYGSIASSSISLCPGAVANAITASVPLNITDYSVQWYYKEGTFTCPSGASNGGWIAVDGATSFSYTPTEFTGTRTFACFMSPSAIYNIPNQWIPGCRVISYYVFDAQPIIGNPNITPFSTLTYAVNPIAGNTFNWTVSNGAIVSGQGTSVIQVLWGQNGPYQVSLSESNGTCSDVSTLLVVNSSCSLSAAITSTNGNAFCPGGTNELIASSNGTNLSYTWYLNGVEIASATEQSFGITSAGNYQVMVNDGLCSAVSQILNITQLSGVQWPEITVLEQNADCASASATITATGGNATSYEWSNGETSAEIIVTESGEYVLTVTNDSGCSADLPPVVINFAQSEPLPICLVTVNPDNGFNTIIWEPLTSEVIVNYVVLKETNAANQYEVIGTVPYGSDGLFEDINSNSAVQASRYKLAINDLCNVVSTNSPLHKTIHLTSNVGLNNTVNLIWSHYEGVDFLSYNIYRGSTPTDMTLLATIASNLNSYTDLNPLSGQAYYFIEVEGIACDPSRSIQTSKSNLINYEFVNIQEIIAPIFSIYPNPTRDYITVQCNAELIGEEYRIYDVAGKMVMKGRITSTTAMIDIKNLSAGEYVLSAGMASVRLVKN